MSSISSKVLIAAAMVAGLALANPLGVAAQDLPPAKLTLVAANGDRLDYTASDASLYITTSPGYEGSPATTDLALSLSNITPLDTPLLNWAAQTSGKRKVYDIILTTAAEAGSDEEIRYEVSGAKVNSFSTAMSSYASPSISLSLTGGKLVMNGVPMN